MAPACHYRSSSIAPVLPKYRSSEPLLDQAVTPSVLNRLIYDRATDRDPLRQRLAERGIELIFPHRQGRVRPATQDGRPLRRYRKRWIVERLVTRHEYYAFLFHSSPSLPV